MKDKTLRLAEGCLNLTIIRKTEHQKQRLKPTGLAKPGKTCTFLDMDSDLAYLEAAGWIFRWVWKQTELFVAYESRQLVG